MDERRRRRINALTLATPFGRLVARLGGAALRPGPHGSTVGVGYRLPLPAAPAFTVGNVVVVRRAELADDLRLLDHELRHADQWARWLGLPFLPAYLLACGWSWLATGDFASGNMFERGAGLADGGYVERPLRPVLARWLRRRRRLPPT